jgi:hypothetical protein
LKHPQYTTQKILALYSGGSGCPKECKAFFIFIIMYVYLIKCSIYYKIGFSKNPQNRLKTIKTHNPFDVKLFATLKTDNYLSVEKNLHNLFANKNSKREWFELNEDDLISLKIDYGFNFLIPINSIKNNEVKNITVLNEIKEFRIDNSKIDYVKEYFEQLFDCEIQNIKELKRVCLKFDLDIIKNSIDSLYNQENNANTSYGLLYKVCSNILQIKENPSKHVVKIIKAIMYKQYNSILNKEDLEYLEDNYISDLDHEDVIKTLNSKKFYLNENDFWYFICKNYIL